MKGYVGKLWRDALSLGIVLLLVSVFHGRSLLPGQTSLPVDLANTILPWRDGPPGTVQNALISDPLYQFYPFVTFNIETTKSGAWPLWNPQILLGHPVVADPVAQPFYPVFTVLGLLLGAARAIAIGLWLHVVLAAALTFGLLRTMRCSRPAAMLGALTYALSGYLVTWYETLFWTSTLAWLPGVLWAFELAVRRRRLEFVAVGGMLFGIAILGGQLVFAATFGLFLILYALGRSIELALVIRRSAASAGLSGATRPALDSAAPGHAPLQRQRAQPLWPLIIALGIGSVGVLLAAIQILPFAEFLNLSQRRLERGLSSPLLAQQLITLIVPKFYGSPVNSGAYWGQLNFSEGTIYAGLASVLLACMAPFVARRRFFAAYLALLAGLIIYFALKGPGVQLLETTPLIKYFSLHRTVFLLPLLVALLAAMAVDATGARVRTILAAGLILAASAGLAVILNLGQARDHWTEIQPGFVQATTVLAVASFLLILRERRPALRAWASYGLVALVYLDLYLVGSTFNPSGPIEKLTPKTPAIEYLQAQETPYRVVAYLRTDGLIFGPNVASVFGLAEPGGYSSVVSRQLRQLFEIDDPKGKHWNILALTRPSERLLDLLQVQHTISGRSAGAPHEHPVVLASECDGDSGEITSSNSVSGTVFVEDTAINRLDLRFRVYEPGPPAGALRIRMWQGMERQRQFLDVDQDAAALQDGQSLTWYFAPERGGAGKTYVWEVSALGPAAKTGVGLCTTHTGVPAASIYGVDWSEVYRGEVYIQERLAPMPRAYVAYAAVAIDNDREAATRLLDPSFDLRNTAITSMPVTLPSEAPLPATPAVLADYRPTKVVVQATALQNGLLVLGDQFHPGWQATVDGKPAAVIRANHVMRGVLLPPGDHEVVFQFRPASLQTGSRISLVGLLMVCFLAVAPPTWSGLKRQVAASRKVT